MARAVFKSYTLNIVTNSLPQSAECNAFLAFVAACLWEDDFKRVFGIYVFEGALAWHVFAVVLGVAVGRFFFFGGFCSCFG